MANTANPIVVTTASATPIMKGQAFVTLFRYVGATTTAAGDECKVTDVAGNVIFDTIAPGAEWVDGQSISKEQMAFFGLVVPTLTSGTLYIHLR